MYILRNNFFILKYLTKTNKLYLFIIFIQYLFSDIFAIVNIFLIKTIIDSPTNNKPFMYIIIILGCYALFLIAKDIIESYGNHLLIPKLTIQVSETINKEIMGIASTIDLECYDNAEFYDKYVKAMQEVEGRAFSVFYNIIGFIRGVFSIVSIFAIILVLDYVMLIFVVFACITKAWVVPKSHKLYYKLNDERTPINRKLGFYKMIFSNKSYAKEIRIFSLIKNLFNNKFDESTKEALNMTAKTGVKLFKINMVTSFANVMFVHIFPYTYLAYSAMIGKITAGSISALFNALFSFSSSVFRMSYILAELKNQSLYIDNLKFILNYTPKIDINQDNLIDCGKIKSIEFKDVYFKYNENDNYILKNISFRIDSNVRIAIVGHNGAGKSTIIKLLLRLYDANKGKILINDIDIKKYNVKSIRKCYCAIFQDFSLFPISITENILMKKASNKNEQESVKDCLKNVGLYDKIKSLSNGMDTNLTKEFDSEGVVLSGGEMQKLAIARMYSAKDSDVYLLDEPSSSLDPISENEFYMKTSELIKDKIVIFVTHRLSSIHMADKIYMLKNGEIIEQGNFDELIKMDNEFSHYYNLQAQYYITRNQINENNF